MGNNTDMDDVGALVRVVGHQDGSVPVCEITGELDASNVEQVLDRIIATVPNDAPGAVVDLSRTTYLDSAGVRTLFELSRRLRSRRQELRIVVPDNGIVRRVLILTALADVVALDATVPVAVDAVRSRA